MKHWPSLRTALTVWALLTLFAAGLYVAYLRTLPVDELVVANTLRFQIAVASVVVGVPAAGLLLLFLMVGAIIKGGIQRRRPAQREVE